MAPLKVWAPVFDADHLPDSFSKAVRAPIDPVKPLPEPENDNNDDNDDDDAKSDDGSEQSEYSDKPVNIKRRQSTLAPIKRARSSAPLNPQYGDSLITPRQLGGQAPRKPVLVDMDSEDEMIWNMKNGGYKDEPVAAALVACGKIHYDSKTIATRYSRIKKIQEVQEEKHLDEDFSDFHEDEDTKLAECVATADAKYQRALEIANQHRWIDVAQIMNDTMNRKKYTKSSARARYESLQNGTAIIPVEQDPDHIVRTARRQHMVAKQQRERREQLELERAQKRSAMERAEREAKETATKRLQVEEQRRIKRMKDEENKAKAAKAREEKSKKKMEESEDKATTKAQQDVERAQKKKQDEETRAAKKWEREQEKIRRREAKGEEALQKIRSNAEKAAAKIIEEREDNKRRELIRRHMRTAGILTAAPMEAPSTRLARKAGNFTKGEHEDVKPNKDDLDRDSNWSPWTAKGRAIQRKKGKKTSRMEVESDTE